MQQLGQPQEAMTPQADPDGDGDANQMMIPAAAVAVKGTAPAVGDQVEFNVKGKVTAVQGDQLSILTTSVNDQPISGGNGLDEMEKDVNNSYLADDQQAGTMP